MKTATEAARPFPNPAQGASIKILSPTKGPKAIKCRFHTSLSRVNVGHHAYVDGELMGMFESEKGTLNGIKIRQTHA